MLFHKHILCIFLISNLNFAFGWDSEELEVFDVVDEVKDNFYTLLNVSKDASSHEIRSAFRTLSLKLHPDKNLDVDTSEQFRNLVSAYEILRSSTKRKIYDDVLVNGLPNWRSAVYYYRYYRKMGLIEACIILFIMLTLGQYLVLWGIYFEKKLDYSMRPKTRRKQVVHEFSYPKPSFYHTLPVQLPCLLYSTITSLPELLRTLRELREIKEREKMLENEEKVIVPPQPRIRTKKRKGFEVPEGPTFEMVYNNATDAPKPLPTALVGGLWTDDDLIELIRLVKKYPQGTPKRWEVIGEQLGRTVENVTYMANKMKENGYKLPQQEEEEVVVKVKQKTKRKEESGEENAKKWDQVQQKALEEALAKYPKGCTERWERVAACVPNKTKEECMLRFRYIAESLKKQKIGNQEQEIESRIENGDL